MKTKIIVLLCFLSVLTLLSFTTIINRPLKNYTDIGFKLDNYQDNNKKAWSKVDSLEKAGLTRSALAIVEQIYQKAKKENNSPQIIKSLIYKLKYINYTEENSNNKVITQIDNCIDSSSLPTTSVLQSILADAYWQYYRQNRYRFANRTATVNYNNNDFDLVNTSFVLHEFPDKEKALNEIKRVLKQNGIFCLTEFNRCSFQSILINGIFRIC